MATIGVFDSGSGGLSVLREIRKILPHERYLYYSDNAHCPYGEKAPDYIADRGRAITRELMSRGAQAVVVACNTATAAAISTLRAEFPIPFVGMEPAVKPAALGTRSGVIGVLATAGTLVSSKYLDNRGLYESSVRIAERVGRGYVELVESLDLDSPHALEVVRSSLQPLLDEGADTIVLGCTHYPFLLPLMQKCAPPGVRFIDPAPAVARRLQDVLSQAGIPTGSGPGSVELLSSGPSGTMKQLFTLI
mgnify:CR=1 FL=1